MVAPVIRLNPSDSPSPVPGIFMATAPPVRSALAFVLTAMLTLGFFCSTVVAQPSSGAPTPEAAPSFSNTLKLTEAGEFEPALQAINRALQTRPQDAQWRFLKGTVLTRMGRTTEALVVFTTLTEDFPNLPEPHNNLAVLQAAQGQIGQARVSLEAAVRADPKYAVAHENLGDVQLRLALEAYQNAIAAGGDSSALIKKMKPLQLMLNPTDTLVNSHAQSKHLP